MGVEEPGGGDAGDEGGSNDPLVLEEFLGLEFGSDLAHGVVEVEDHGEHDHREDEDEVVQCRVGGHGDAGAEAEQIGVGDHGDDQFALGVNFEAFAIAAGEVGVVDEAVFGVALAGHQQGTKEPPCHGDGNWRHRQHIGRHDGIPPEPQADRVVERLGDDVEERAVFEPDGLDVVNESTEKQQAKCNGVADIGKPQPTEEKSADDESGHHGPENRHADFACGDAAELLGRMEGVEGGVEDLVHHVVRGGDEARWDERQDGIPDHRLGDLHLIEEHYGDGMTEHDEDVLQPMFDAADFDVFDDAGHASKEPVNRPSRNGKGAIAKSLGFGGFLE